MYRKSPCGIGRPCMDFDNSPSSLIILPPDVDGWF